MAETDPEDAARVAQGRRTRQGGPAAGGGLLCALAPLALVVTALPWLWLQAKSDRVRAERSATMPRSAAHGPDAVRGKVLEPLAMTPMPAVPVRLSVSGGETSTAATAPDGTFALRAPAAASWRLRVGVPGIEAAMQARDRDGVYGLKVLVPEALTAPVPAGVPAELVPVPASAVSVNANPGWILVAPVRWPEGGRLSPLARWSPPWIGATTPSRRWWR